MKSSSIGRSMWHAQGLFPVCVSLLVGVIGVIFWITPAPAIATDSPTEAIRQTIYQVIRVLKTADADRSRKALRNRKLEAIVDKRVDYTEMTKRALGAQWEKLTAQERQEFTGLFARVLKDSFTSRINNYTDEEVEYLNERIIDEYAEVETRLHGSKLDLPVTYRLMNQAGTWQVYDILVDGISVIRNYRAQFARLLERASYDELVERLRRKGLDPPSFDVQSRR